MSALRSHSVHWRGCRFVYVTDAGEVFSTEDEPTAQDRALAGVGMVTILRLSDGRFLGRTGDWQPILTGELTAAVIAGEPVEPFHAKG